MSLLKPSDSIAIFGARGMAGSAICRALSASGYNNQLRPSRQELNLLNSAEVSDWFYLKKPNVVVLAAAKVGGILANQTYPADFLLENLKIQNNVIELAWRSGVSRLLFLGSSCIYPKHTPQPIPEEALMHGALEPTNQGYALAKITGIELCNQFRLQYGFDALSLMPTNLYGPGDNYHPNNSHVLPALLSRFHQAKQSGQEQVICWGSGSPRREFMHVDDLGLATVFALESWDPLCENSSDVNIKTPLGHLNVGTGSDISIKDLAELIAQIVGFQGDIMWDASKPDGTPRKLLDVSRIHSLGWKAQLPLNRGLPLTYADFCSELEASVLRC